MNRCPITYELCGDRKYSEKGLRFLSKKLKDLKDFGFTPKEQIELAMQHADKMSIQGMQPKLSVKLSITKEEFYIVDQGGVFIFKPPSSIYPELPQNEDLTMKLAKILGIETPLHGMIYTIDGSLTYFIKRFDRLSHGHKVATEDFSQLLGYTRDTKYESSMEKIIPVIDKHCTFPIIEKIKLFRITLFNFLIGNEDMHLKNFSLIRRKDKVELSPAYDLLNTSIVLNAKEEIALPIRGKKSNLKPEDFFQYFGKERLGLSDDMLKKEIKNIQKAFPSWIDLLKNSFLSQHLRKRYLELLQERWKRLSLG